MSETTAIVLPALACTLLGLAYLAATDAKRRRAFGLGARPRRFAWPARVAVFAPGLALATAGAWAAFTIWLGAATVAGWGVAASPPGGIARLIGGWRGRRQRPAGGAEAASRARKSAKVFPGSASKASPSTATSAIRSRRKQRKSRRVSHQATSSQIGP